MDSMFDEKILTLLPSEVDPEVNDFVPQISIDELEERRLWLDEDARPFIEEINRHGFSIPDSWGLLKFNEIDYDKIIPILLKHLMLPYHPMNLEGIARSLAISPARLLAWDLVKQRLFEARIDLQHPKDVYFRNCCLSLRNALCNTIGKIATKNDLSEILEMLSNPKLGNGRALLLTPFHRYFDPRVIPILKNIKMQNNLSYECSRLLNKKKYRNFDLTK